MILERKTRWIISGILILIAVISFFVLAKVFSDPETFKGTIQVLDDKKNIVAKMSAISIAAASAIDLIPGEAGRSVSEALVNLSGYFVLLFAAIYLEKLLISIGGYIAFKVLVPGGLLLIVIFLKMRYEALRAVGLKLISTGLILFLLVPSSVWVSGMVDKTHDMSKQQAIEEIGEETELIEKDADTADKSEEKGVVSSLIGKVQDGASSALAKAKEVPKKMNDLLDHLIDEIAYYFVSICVIPIVVLVILIVLVKQLLGFMPSGGRDTALLLREIHKINSGTNESLE